MHLARKEDMKSSYELNLHDLYLRSVASNFCRHLHQLFFIVVTVESLEQAANFDLQKSTQILQH
jgi:hypothetical protein